MDVGVRGLCWAYRVAATVCAVEVVATQADTACCGCGTRGAPCWAWLALCAYRYCVILGWACSHTLVVASRCSPIVDIASTTATHTVGCTRITHIVVVSTRTSHTVTRSYSACRTSTRACRAHTVNWYQITTAQVDTTATLDIQCFVYACHAVGGCPRAVFAWVIACQACLGGDVSVCAIRADYVACAIV